MVEVADAQGSGLRVCGAYGLAADGTVDADGNEIEFDATVYSQSVPALEFFDISK